MSGNPSTAPSDEQLIAAINRGDTAAFQTLYHRYRDWVVRLAYRLTGDREIALDVMQETFSYLLGKFPGFTLTARMTTFLYPAVRHLAIAHRRRRDRMQPTDPQTPEPTDPHSAGPAVDVRAELAVVLSELDEPIRETILMRFVDDMSIEEIAAALDIPPGTVKSRLHNAIKRLRASPKLREHYFG